MKKLLVMTMVLVSTVLVSCSKEEDRFVKFVGTGSIYGIVTYVDSTVPIKGVGISLYGTDEHLRLQKIMTTTVFDDGSYEFKDISFLYYKKNDQTRSFYIGIESKNLYLTGSSYYDGGYYVKVVIENGRSKRMDLQVTH